MSYINNNEENDLDSVFDEAVRIVIENKLCSASFLQRRLMLGYARAARLVDQLEKMSVIGPQIGNKPREVYFDNVDCNGKIINNYLYKKHTEEIEYLNWKKKNAFDINELNVILDNKKLVNFDFDKYKNLLIIGSQQTGALNLTNNILLRLSEKYSPVDFKILVIDGVRNEITLPVAATHLLTPITYDYDKALTVLKWSLTEISRRQKNIEAKRTKILVMINSINQFADFKKNELMSLVYQLLIQGKDYGFYLVINTDFPTKNISKEIIANTRAFVFFKQSDKKIIKDFNINKVEKFTSPDQAIFTSMFEETKEFVIEKIDYIEEYKNIFE